MGAAGPWQAPEPPPEEKEPVEWDALVWVVVTVGLFLYAGLAQKPLLALLSIPIGIGAGLATAIIMAAVRDD